MLQLSPVEEFAYLWMLLAECLPHPLSFGALSPRAARSH
jgi:hypothetical protein